MSYVKARSWHVLVRDGLTRCGRLVRGPESETLPLDEKSCETCLRLQANDEHVANDTVAE